MKEETINKILEIAKIKLNLLFIIVFTGAILFCATKLGEATLIREIFFWTAMILIIILKIQPSVSFILDSIEEWVVSRKEIKYDANEKENEQ